MCIYLSLSIYIYIYLFILLLTTITFDVKQNMSLEEQIIVNAGKLHNIDLTELFYADDTLIMASTAAAAETILQHLELESGKYNMNLNHTKCIHLRLSDLERITYMNGTEVPMEQEAIYLGGKIFSNGSYKKDNSHRISNTWHAIQKLDLLWKKAPVSMKLKIIVFDAVIVSKLVYGLEPVPFTEQDCNRLVAFPYGGLRKNLHIKHPFLSNIKNKDVQEFANTRAATKSNKQIAPLSQHLGHRQIKLYGDIIRAEDLDLMNKVSMYQDGTRRKTPFKRTGRPRSKWHTVTRKHTIKHLIDKSAILRFWQNHIRDNEFDHLIVGAAEHRVL